MRHVNFFGPRPEPDGVVAFDEAHKMGNAVRRRGKRGWINPSATALAGMDLQGALPNARVLYVSATGATEVYNLAYAPRLGPSPGCSRTGSAGAPATTISRGSSPPPSPGSVADLPRRSRTRPIIGGGTP
jgi:hypothetical protein